VVAYTYITLDDPLETNGTDVRGINDAGQIVGDYRLGPFQGVHGFIYSGGAYTTIDDPLGGEDTIPYGINNTGQIVGQYAGFDGQTHGFLYSDGTYTTLDDPLSDAHTQAIGIDDAGDIVGNYTSGGWHGFIDTGGTYTTIDDPLGTGTFIQGINGTGEIVGDYTGADGGTHGFLYNAGTYTTLDDPLGVNGTNAQGINDAGEIVGYYRDNSLNYHSFLYNNGTYTTFDDANATSGTFATGINNSGEIVGNYTDSGGTYGFLADPTTLVWASASSFPDEVQIYTPSLSHSWFGGTQDFPSADLGTWYGPDFVTDDHTVMRIWAQWNGLVSPILDVAVESTTGADPYYGSGQALAQLVAPSGNFYSLFVNATASLQSYDIQVNAGQTIHHGDELWALLYPSWSAYGADHWLGAAGDLPAVEFLEEGTPVNQPPTIDTTQSSVAGVITEQLNVTASTSLDSTSGAIAFSDPDNGDRPTASVLTQSETVTYTDANGTDDRSQLTSDQISIFENAFSIVPETGNTNSGKIDWTYSIADKNLDFLGVGETLKILAPVQLDDGHGGTVTQDVLVTLNGADDLPVASPDVATAQKGTTVTADAAHGVLVNDSDPDIHDVLHVSALNGLSMGVGHAVTGLYGALTLNADGSYAYVANKNVPQNQNLADTFSYTVDDGHGGTAVSTLSFTIQKGDSHQVPLPFSGDYQVTQGPADGGFGDHTGFSKWSFDFNLPVGTPALAVGHGKVVDMREYVPDGTKASSAKTDKNGKLIPDPTDLSNGSGSDGNYVTIQLDDGTYVSYLHLGHNKVSVNIGDVVNTGDVLGFTGLTGFRTGPHLHIQFGTGFHTAAAIASNPLDIANNVKGIFADGSNDKNSPEYFSNLTVHLDLSGGPKPPIYNAGVGAETFVFQKLSDGGYMIDGFQHGVDKIDLSALDANTALAGDQAFTFSDMNKKVVANSVDWYEKGGNTIVQADNNGDGVADFTLTLAGINHHLSATDFKL